MLDVAPSAHAPIAGAHWGGPLYPCHPKRT